MATIFALGSNGSGQLGIGHKEDVSVPKPVLFAPGTAPPQSITKVAAGGNHTILLSGDGEIYWSGDATSGACGFIPQDAPLQPHFRRLARRRPNEAANEGLEATIQHLAATWTTTVFTTSHNKVYASGLGSKGELGLGTLIIRSPTPQLIPDFPPAGTSIVDLSACMGHIVAVLSNGDVYGWGNGRKGQLGTPNDVIHSPRRIEGVDFAVRRADCGKDFTCLVGDSDSGAFAILGENKWGINSGKPADMRGWTDVAASWSNIYVRDSTGRVTSWGRDDYSQNAPPNFPPVSSLAVGSEHFVALLENGDVVARGWGEHGNCGPGLAGNDEKGTANVIASSKYVPPGSRIAGVGAGCATSWIVIQEDGS